MFKSILPQGFLKFLFLLLITIGFTYLSSRIFTTLWYLILLILYFKSDDEALWLAFFLVTVDGFMGFFGSYTVTIRLFPGLPGIELAQFYVLLSLIKAGRIKFATNIFFNKYLQILLLYLLFLIIWSQFLGFSGEMKAYIRIVKATLSLILFYSIPRLFSDIENYNRFFGFIFSILILGFIAQLFTLFTGLSPAVATNLTEEQLTETETFRSFYNPASTLLGLFGSLIFISSRHKTTYNTIYLFLVIIAGYGMAFLSATRGWILSFTLIIILSFLFTNKIKLRRLIGFLMVSILVLLIGLSNNKIRDQLRFSRDRISKLESIVKGDITAEGTVVRLSERSSRVMQKWAENPIFGWGASDVSRDYGDGHVGNQNLLMSSGIVGFSLIIGFFFYFCYKLFSVFKRTTNLFYLRNTIPVFILFLLGWFIIHSTSGQQFGLGGTPLQIIPQAVFFSMGALVYAKSKNISNEQKV